MSKEATGGDRARFAVVTKHNALTLNDGNGIKTIDVLMSSCARFCGSHGTVGIHLWQDTGVHEPFSAEPCGDSGSNFAVTFSTLANILRYFCS